jgi:hypothetical protein
MLNEDGVADDSEIIDSLCSEPCPSCDTENDYFKLNPPSAISHRSATAVKNFESFSLN